MNVISCDVGWKSETKRHAMTVVTPSGEIVFLKNSLDDDQLIALIGEWSEPQSLVLLDVPIEGCETLSPERPRRDIENALQHWISLYAALNAKQRGKQLKEKLLKALPTEKGGNLIIKEIYPYAVYKFLWYAKQQGKLAEVRSSQIPHIILDERFKPSLSPPKYKGSRVNHNERITGMLGLHNLLTQQLGLRFSQPLELPSSSSSRSELELLADQYDACLGAVVGLFCVAGNPYAWLVGNERQGEMLLLADIWFIKRLEEWRINLKRYP